MNILDMLHAESSENAAHYRCRREPDCGVIVIRRGGSLVLLSQVAIVAQEE